MEWDDTASHHRCSGNYAESCCMKLSGPRRTLNLQRLPTCQTRLELRAVRLVSKAAETGYFTHTLYLCHLRYYNCIGEGWSLPTCQPGIKMV